MMITLKRENISRETRDKLSTGDIVALPSCYQDGEYYFSQETINFLKFCKQNDSEHNYDILADGDIKVRSLHSFDIWLPIIWIANNVLLPMAINMVCNYIWEKRKGHEKEETQVDVTFIVKSKGMEKSIHFIGDADTFKNKFEKIDLNKI
ncbi:MAG: hypothetical protein K2O06_10010 [Acetatifactor sp.]|nr:hypothetical protein [Acetatifactor sp.]